MGTPIHQLNGLSWSSDDLRKKFTNSFVKATILSAPSKPPLIEKALVYIMNPAFVGDNEDDVGEAKVRCVYFPRAPLLLSEEVAYIHPSKFLVDEDRPAPCISNVGESGAFYFTYNPARQWKRGFGPENCHVYQSPDVPCQLSNERAQRVLNPEHSSIAEALQQFKEFKSVNARALTNDYWLIRDAPSNVVKLYIRHTILGSFIRNRFFVKESARILSRELMKDLPDLRGYYATY